MGTKRFRLRLLISRARLGEKPLETWRAELCAANIAGLPLPSIQPSRLQTRWCQRVARHRGARARDLNQEGGNQPREPVGAAGWSVLSALGP